MTQFDEIIKNYKSKYEKINSDHADVINDENFGLQNIQLRPYQSDGISWMLERHDRSHGCLLGDEMGLGKTCQSIGLLLHLSRTGVNKPFLVVCPLSVLQNWSDELKLFATKLEVVRYVGTRPERDVLKKVIKKKQSSGALVVLTSYEICLKDDTILGHFAWHALIVDEAQRLKNEESQLHQTLKKFDVLFRLLLTGTPVQNNLQELFALISFAAPNIFKTKLKDEFVAEFEDREDMTKLHTLLRPFLLRRTKDEVVKDLPSKAEIVLYHGLSSLQKRVYKGILLKDLDIFENNEKPNKNRLLNVLMQLRKCVNHPYLFNGVEPEPFELGEHLIESSAKLVLLDQLLKFLHKNGHKVLLFSQMTHMLDIIQDYVGYRGYSYERLDGSVRREERFLAINNFNKDTDTFLFLLSTKAGGTGLNLTAADTVIFLDSDFNPQNDLQAAARAHRIGQTRPVKIVRMVGRHTVEEVVLSRAQHKLRLTHEVIEQGQFSLGNRSEQLFAKSSAELQEVLKFGLDELLKEGSGAADVDFEKLLGKSENGQWLAVTEESVASTSSLIDDYEQTESIYVFEGQDYSTQDPSEKDDTALKLLIQEKENKPFENNNEKGPTLRRGASAVLTELPESQRKTRKPLTEEEKEERRKKREENKRKKEELENLKLQRKKEEIIQKLQKLWQSNGYETLSLPDPPSDEEAEQTVEPNFEMNDEEESDEPRHQLNYVVGDVTKPQENSLTEAIILHCVDDSGNWGSGGLFSAISQVSRQPEEQYTTAKKMKDLHLGDAHLISLQDGPESGLNLHICLIVAQHRDKHGSLSGIKLPILEDALKKIAVAAKDLRASVHLPRIGHKTPDFNWYGTERLLKKLLVNKDIPTNVYYYKPSSTHNKDHDQPSCSKALSEEDSSDEPQLKKRKVTKDHKYFGATSLPDFFSGVSVAFCDVPDDVQKHMRRYIIAYDGDVEEKPSDTVTHLVTVRESSLQGINQTDSSFDIVSLDWLRDCIEKQRRLSVKTYRIKTGEVGTETL